MFKNKHVLSAIMINTRLEFLPLVVLCVKHLGKTCLPGLDSAILGLLSCHIGRQIHSAAGLGHAAKTHHSLDRLK